MKQKILLFFILLVQLYAVFQWTQCRDFIDQFHFSSFDLSLRLIDNIHNDKFVPIWEVRLFHNKVAGVAFDFFAQYLQFWNVSFLASFLSLAGVIGLAAQFYYFFSRKKKHFLLINSKLIVL